MINKVMQSVYETGMIVAVRGVEEHHILLVLEALYQGGVRCVEITLGNPRALNILETAISKYNGKLHIGCGTVLDAATACSAIHAGAEYVLTPKLDIETITACNRYSIPCIPGAFTATEVLSAWEAGASMVKIFPVSSVGARYIKDLRGPFPDIRMMPMGGVDLDNIAEFLKAGAFAVGVGSSLLDKAAIERADYQAVSRKAAQFMELVTR